MHMVGGWGIITPHPPMGEEFGNCADFGEIYYS